MKHKKLIVEDWQVCYCMDIGTADMATISEKIDSLKVPSKMKEGAFINLSRENCGSTIANQTQKKILVLISPQSSKAELINTLAHETRHVVDILCIQCGCENAARLSGEIMARFAEWIIN